MGGSLATVKGLRVAYSPTFGYARPDPAVSKSSRKRSRTLEPLGCEVERVEKVFDKDPVDLWTAEFYAGVGIRLRSFVEKQRDMLDPAVAEVLEGALSQDMRSYYEKVFERYAFRDQVRTFFEKYDVLVSPVMPVSSVDVGINIPKHLSDRNLVSWIYYTYPFNLTGQPAGTVCAGHRTGRHAGWICTSSGARWVNTTWCDWGPLMNARSRRDIIPRQGPPRRSGELRQLSAAAGLRAESESF